MIRSLAPDFRLKLDGIPEDVPGFRIEEEFTAGVGVVRLLLAGALRAPHPELNYPCVTAEDETGSITVVYQENQLVTLEPEAGKMRIVGNASASPEVYFELTGTERTGRIFDCLGNDTGETTLTPGMRKIAIPPSGFLFIPAG